ncbi:MAG TPA: type IV pilus assembly protein PilM [Gaiellaceae bacterium]|nr:type IV pilus assembly protein PilM [Gaiellaceae bacterium]
MGDESIWKKEISFGRKRKENEEPERQAGDGDEPTSIWKKELSFGRKKKAEPVADEPVADETVAAEEPAWTRAVSFGRKADPEPVADDLGPIEGTVPEPGPQEPVAAEEETWTRAVSFGRKADPEPVADDLGPVEGTVPEAGPEEPVAAEEETWTRAVSFGRKADPEPVADDLGPVEGTVPEPGPEEPVADEEPAWTRAVSFGRKSELEPVADEPAAVADDSGPVGGTVPEPGPQEPVASEPAAPEPVAVVPEPVEAEPSAQVWSAQPEVAPPTQTWSATPAPVTVDELPAAENQEQEEKKVPFWKKEIGGKKKGKAPKQKADAVADTPEPAPDPDKKVPFWKTEIGGKKKEKAPKAERAPKPPKQPKEKKQKKVKAPKQPKVKAARGSRGAKRITGLKIGASQLAAARVANNGSAELLQIARTPLEPGIVVGGELRDPDALAEALKDFFAKNNLPKKGVRLGIANNRIGVRTFDIAGIDDDKQLTNAIRFRAQETLPIPIDEAVLDYQVLGDGTSEDGQPTKRVLLVVAYRDLIDRYVEACKKAGISLVGIDLEAFALLRALQAPLDDAEADAALVAVAIGHDRSTFAVSDGRICEFTRVLEWGGSALNVAIARALDAAPSEVDSVKRALALTDEMVPEGLTAEQAQKARDAMRRAIQTFARELVSSLQYYQNQPGSLGIGEIVLTGGTAHLAGLSSELERLIGVRVRVGDPLGRMKVSKKVGEAEQVGSLAVAIGLGIED